MSTTTETARWRNISAGPRQVTAFNKAVGALRWEGQTFEELTGVAGGDEHRATLTSMFGAVRPEVIAAGDAIRAKYDGQVTSANVRQIIADYEAAAAEAARSRPVQDKRRTPDEDAKLRAAAAAREAACTAQRDAQTAVLSQVMAKAPAGAKGLIYAEYREDDSDPMTDYFSSRTMRTVAIGFRSSSREDFRALRSAAGQFPETAHLASQDAYRAWLDDSESWLGRESIEHRDNYSMGAGNYLSDHGGAKSGTGWIVKSCDFPCQWVSLTEDAMPATPVTPAAVITPAVGGVTVSPSSLGREGVVEIRFAERPAGDVLAALKAHGFRWARGNRCWYGSDTAYAETLAAG